MHKLGFEKVIERLNGRSLRVATMCSGTESPMLAIENIAESKFTQIYPITPFNILYYRLVKTVFTATGCQANFQCRDCRFQAGIH